MTCVCPCGCRGSWRGVVALCGCAFARRARGPCAQAQRRGARAQGPGGAALRAHMSRRVTAYDLCAAAHRALRCRVRRAGQGPGQWAAGAAATRHTRRHARRAPPPAVFQSVCSQQHVAHDMWPGMCMCGYILASICSICSIRIPSNQHNKYIDIAHLHLLNF